MVEASDTLRKAVAVQSFREALEGLSGGYLPGRTGERETELSKRAQAFAVVSIPEENLMQSVEIYEELLQARSRAEDPGGLCASCWPTKPMHWRISGLFSQSLEKANEAYKLFHWHNEADAANSVLELVGERA